MTTKVKRIIELLDLQPLPVEGGYYRESYRSDEMLTKPGLPSRYNNPRLFASAIYYLITPDTFSSLHKLLSDELFHFYLGDEVEMLQLFEDGTGKIIRLGSDIENGCVPQALVPKYAWQGSRLADGGEFALMGTTMSPGFDFEDFTPPNKAELIQRYPAFSEQINKLII